MQRIIAPAGKSAFCASAISYCSLSLMTQRRWSASTPQHSSTTGSSSSQTTIRFSSASAASASSQAPYTSPEIASMLSSPELTREVIMKLSESKRRELLVAASYYEWFGDEDKVTPPADRHARNTEETLGESRPQSSNKDNGSTNISGNIAPNPSTKGSLSDTITDSNDSMNFSWDDMRRRHKERRKREEEQRAREELREAHPMPTFPMTKDEYNEWIRDTVQTMNDPTSSTRIPFRVLVKVAIQTGLPFLAFGTLDNSMLILAGDMLDNLVGAELKLSTMGAAAMGGIVSGVVGIQIHGLAERAVTKYGPPQPALKPSQWRSKPIQAAIHWGGTFGLVCGLLLGMFPLLLISDSASVRRALDDD